MQQRSSTRWRPTDFIYRLAIVLVVLAAQPGRRVGAADLRMLKRVRRPPLAIPAFHCLGLYWSPAGGATGKEVAVRYQPGHDRLERGAADALQPDPRHRGRPGRLSRQHRPPCARPRRIVNRTSGWPARRQPPVDRRPPGRGVSPWPDRSAPSSSGEPLAIQQVGRRTPGSVYDGRGDRRPPPARRVHRDRRLVRDRARGFTLKEAAERPVISPARRSAAIRIEGRHDIVIEDCDVSDWGRLVPRPASASTTIRRSIRASPR